jgi:hypothetical protein
MSEDQRQQFDDQILSRPGAVDPETGLRPPTWWRDEDDAAASAKAFTKNLRR